MSDTPQAKARPARRLLAITGGLIAFGASIVTIATFIGDEKPNKKFEIRITTSIKLTPPSPEGAAKDLTITYKDSPLLSPHQIQITASNGGNIPITHQDVESDATLQILSSKVIAVNTVNLSPTDLYATCTPHEEHTDKVKITHQLMNPGDSITCDILLDGEPSAYELFGRISGIPSPTLHPYAPAPQTPRFIDLPDPIPLALLILSSTGAFIGFFISLFLAIETLDLQLRWKTTSEDDIRKHITPDAFFKKIQESMSASSNIIAAAASPYFRTEWILSPESIQSDLSRLSSAELDSIFAKHKNAATLVAERLPSFINSARVELLARISHHG